MRISRFFLPQKLSPGATIPLEEESAHYLRTVLRLKRGADLIVFNGEGGEYPAVVVEAHKEAVSVELGEFNPRDLESHLHTHLGLGIARGERMDLAIQKAVELGVAAITPLFTERCVVQLDDARKQQRLRHWRKIVHSACEQCGRDRLAEVNEPVKLQDWVAQQAGLCLFLHPHGGKTLRELPPPQDGVCLLTGPEGGFAEHERSLALEAGFIPLRLGPRILRTETAALTALAAIQTVWGDLG
ncbi:MAG: 16S rRNA (uracil(1498)-N(3))-methyltransferase [Methylococcaceae bacterium]|nr:16S rRNA (uracil(1498)-N(3))-methyltransferase [Methylococcaceae bacterium]